MKTNILLTSLLLIFIISLLFVSKSFSGNAAKLPKVSISQNNEKKIAMQVQKTNLSKIIFVRAQN